MRLKVQFTMEHITVLFVLNKTVILLIIASER